MSDVVDQLSTDHREALELMSRISAAGTPEERRDLADTVISEVVRHAVAEEMYVYPAMRKYLPDGEEATRHDTKEHKDLEHTMRDLEKCDAADPEFDRLVQRMTEQLRHHIDDEESEQFPALRAALPAEELTDLGQKVERAKALAPTRPHPNAPNSELFHKLVGPGVGLVDRARDRLTNRGQG